MLAPAQHDDVGLHIGARQLHEGPLRQAEGAALVGL